MIIPALANFKTDDVIHLDELMNLVGESLYTSDWNNNIYTQGEPFFRISRQKKTHTRVEVTISNYIMEAKKPVSYQGTFSFPNAEMKHLYKALDMIITVRRKLWTILANKKMPYEVLLSGGTTIESEDIDRGIWSSWYNTILCTGYFPIMKRGKRRWGKLRFEKEKALECINNIKNDASRSLLPASAPQPILISKNETRKNKIPADEALLTQYRPFDMLPAPNWILWEHVPSVLLWQAVALSLNVDPAALEMPGGFDPDSHGGLTDEFMIRLQGAVANFATLGIYRMGHDYRAASQLPVQITEFSKLAVSKGWDLPAGFPKGVSDDAAGIVIVPPLTKSTAGTREKPKNRKKEKQFNGKPGPKTKYPDEAYIKMRELRDSKQATSIRDAARQVAPDYKGQSVKSTAERLAQTFTIRIQKIAG